jgi:maltose O-acetyltransferase
VADYQYRTRIRVLIDGGLVIGRNVTIAPSVNIDNGYPYLIRIGDNCSLSPHVRLLTHDATTFKFTNGHTRIGKVELKDNCFIGERAIILPGVTIGPNVLVAAGSVVNKDIPPNSCVAGVPARFYAKFDKFIERHQQQIEQGSVFEYLASKLDDMDKQAKAEIWEAVQNGHPAYSIGHRDHFTWNAD